MICRHVSSLLLFRILFKPRGDFIEWRLLCDYPKHTLFYLFYLRLKFVPIKYKQFAPQQVCGSFISVHERMIACDSFCQRCCFEKEGGEHLLPSQNSFRPLQTTKQGANVVHSELAVRKLERGCVQGKSLFDRDKSSFHYLSASASKSLRYFSM